MSLLYSKDYILTTLREAYLKNIYDDLDNGEESTRASSLDLSQSQYAAPSGTTSQHSSQPPTPRRNSSFNGGAISPSSSPLTRSNAGANGSANGANGEPNSTADLTGDPNVMSTSPVSPTSGVPPTLQGPEGSQADLFSLGHSSRSGDESDTEYDYGEGDISVAASAVPNRHSPDPTGFQLSLDDDDSDLDDDMVIAAHQLRLTVGAQSTIHGARKSTSRRSTQRPFAGLRSREGSMGNIPEQARLSRRATDPNGALELGLATQVTNEEAEMPPMPPAEVEFSKHAIVPPPQRGMSLLAQQIEITNDSPLNPFDQYKGAVGSVDSSISLTFFLPSKSRIPWTVSVRPDCPVHLALGYALSLYHAAKREPALTEPECDANYWNVRLVEDDGEPDEDFPALDRVRPIESYSVDEFAIVQATEAERKENMARTPSKAVSRTEGVVPMSGDSDDDDSERTHVRVYNYPFDPLLSNVYWEKTLDNTVRIQEVFDTVCREKMLEEDMYVLRLASTKQIVAGTALVSIVHDQQVLELTPKRTLMSEDGTYLAPTSPSKQRRAASVITQQSLTSRMNIAGRLAAPLQPLGYSKYKIWRRQQMSFMGRHERELAIDGEYVHIMPSSDRSLIDTAKTTSFHVRQVIRIKQSSKVPTNFKIFVMKPSGPKRYDLEGVSKAETAEIVEHISRLRAKLGQ